jgi:hypothetical protein
MVPGLILLRDGKPLKSGGITERYLRIFMNRRNFFEWFGNLSLAIGLGYLTAHSKPPFTDYRPLQSPLGRANHKPRMNGRACHDFRMLSADRSIMLDRDIFGA